MILPADIAMVLAGAALVCALLALGLAVHVWLRVTKKYSVRIEVDSTTPAANPEHELLHRLAEKAGIPQHVLDDTWKPEDPCERWSAWLDEELRRRGVVTKDDLRREDEHARKILHALAKAPPITPERLAELDEPKGGR